MKRVNSEDPKSAEEVRKVSVGARLPVFFAYLGLAVCSLIVIAALLEIGSRVALSIYHRAHWNTVADITPDSTAYSSFPWARGCVDEQARRLKTRDTYFPFRLWGNSEWHGKCTNNDITALGAVRRTINPVNTACANHPKVDIWILGGSSIYGTLIPDWATLPSYLSAQLNDASICANITNLGVEGYATNQEGSLLIEKLKGGHIPDLVVMYDGFNDSDIGTSLPGPGTHLGFRTTKARVEGSPADRLDFLRRTALWQLILQLSKPLGRKGPAKVSGEQLQASAVATLDNYQANLKVVRALGQAFGFKVCAFWQPAIIYGHKPLVPYEQQLLKLSAGEEYPFQPLVPVYKLAEDRARGGDYYFLGGVFDSNAEPTYLDWVHLNPRGNEIVAAAMAPYVRQCLK